MKSYINELALGVQFTRSQLTPAQIIEIYWNLFKEEFPEVQEHPPLPLMNLNSIMNLNQQIQINSNIKSRKFFVSKDKDLLVQLQFDKFYLNWRKFLPENPYPTYEILSTKFFQLFQSISDKYPLQIDFKELTYVNRVDHRIDGHPRDLIEHCKNMPDTGNFVLRFNEKLEEDQSVFTYNLVSDLSIAQTTIHLSLRNEAPVGNFQEWFAKSHDFMNKFYSNNFS